MADAEIPTEQWIYAGLRLISGKRATAWLDESGVELLYADSKRNFIVGGEYKVRVTRGDDRVTRHGEPRFVDRVPVEVSRRREWDAETATAETELARGKLERKARAAPTALDDAIAPLIAIAKTQRTRSGRAAFTAYVIQELNRGAW